jgi:hypothetical protein
VSWADAGLGPRKGDEEKSEDGPRGEAGLRKKIRLAVEKGGNRPGQNRRGEEFLFFFPKFSKAIFKWNFEFSFVFESNHSIQKSNATA